MARRIAILLVGVTLALAKVAASGSTESSATSSGPHPTLTVWLGSWWQSAVPDIQDRFAKDNPGYSVKIQLQPVNNYLENATTSIAGGTPPEALDLDTLMLPTPIGKGLVKPLDDFMKRYNIKPTDFVKAVFDSGVSKGKTYAIPDRTAVSALFFNKTMFDKAGVAYPTSDFTMDQFLDAAKKLTIPGKQYGFGIAAAQSDPANVMTSFLPILFAYDGTILNADMTKSTLGSPAGIKAIKFYSDLYRTYKVVPEGTINFAITRDLIPMVQAGTLAMCPMGDSNVPAAKDAMAKNNWSWGLVPLPGGGHSRAGGWSMTIPSTSKDVPGAEKWIAWFTKPDVIAQQKIVMPGTPASRGLGLWNDPTYDIYWEISKTAIAVPPTPAWTQIQNLIVIDLQKTLQGTMTAEQAGADMDAQINALLK